MWCVCVTPEERIVEQWENEIENIIVNIKKARRLGKLCISKRQLGRKDPKLENNILELIRSVDRDILNTKRNAIYFLTANTDLYNERNDQIEFYKQNARKQIYILQLKQELLQVKQKNQILAEEYSFLKNKLNLLQQRFQCHLKGNNEMSNSAEYGKTANSIEENAEYLSKIYENRFVDRSPQLSKRQFKETFSRNNRLIEDLKQLLSACEKDQKQLKSEINSSQPTHKENELEEYPEELIDEQQQIYNTNKEENFDSLESQINDQNERYFSDTDLFRTNAVWLEQELEHQNLLRIQASFRQIYTNFDVDSKKKPSGINKFRQLFMKNHREPLLSLGDDFQYKSASWEENVDVLNTENRENFSQSQRRKEKRMPGSSRYEEIPLVQLGTSTRKNNV